MMDGRGQGRAAGIASSRTVTRVRGLLLANLDALPLGAFLALAAWLSPSTARDWQLPYLVATLLAVAVQAAHWRRGLRPDRIHVALACYFASGAAGVLLGWDWLNRGYGELEATAMLLWVVPVGLCFAILSPAGFVGVAGAPRGLVHAASAALLVLACIAVAWSARHLGDPWPGAVLPFVLLFAARALLRAALVRSAAA